MHHASGDVASPLHGADQGVHCDLGGHAVADRVPDDPVGEHVLDRTEVELAFARGVLGDVPEPQPVRFVRPEPAQHEVVV